MSSTYEPAHEPQRIVAKLISAHHPHLQGCRIECVYKEKATEKGGKLILATTRMVSGLTAYLAGECDPLAEDFFVIVVARSTWDALDPEQQVALVDHELMHCAWDEEKEAYYLRAHDLEEFAAIVRRHGLWKPDLADFVRLTGAQLRLPLDADPETGEVRDPAFTLSAVGSDGKLKSVTGTAEQLRQAAASVAASVRRDA